MLLGSLVKSEVVTSHSESSFVNMWRRLTFSGGGVNIMINYEVSLN